MEDPIFIFKNLLALADTYGIRLKLQNFQSYDSVLKVNHIGIRNQQTFEKVVYETAYELAHYLLHQNKGNTLISPNKEMYNLKAEQAADVMVRVLDVKAKSA